jgi:hypothetical protein
MKALKLAIAASAAALALATLPTTAVAGGKTFQGTHGSHRGHWQGGGHKGHWHGGHSHWRGSVHIGVGWPGYYWGAPYWGGGWGPYYYPRYYYYGAPYYGGYNGSAYGPVYAPVDGPVTYVERSDVAPAANGTSNGGGNWWYWCAGSRNYYPYVKDCPGGWERVAPQPPR